MLKFAGISGSDQLVILNKSDTLQNEAASGKDSNKWSKQRKELFSEMPKIQVTPQRLYSSHLNKLTILETNKSIFDKIMSPNLDSPDLNPEKEDKIECHTSPITCFGIEEEALLICSCSDEHVFLSKWDKLLGHWDSKGISEADGRILSCSIVFKEFSIYVILFKVDVLVVYKAVSAHAPAEPGPLILNSIDCFATLEKVKELTTWSKSVILNENFYIVGIASGNTVSVKLWDVSTENDETVIKIRSHRMVAYLKGISGADLVALKEKGEAFVLVVGNDGVSEVFSLANMALNLLYRFKIEESGVSAANLLNSTQTNLQIDCRILGAKFFLVDFASSESEKNLKDTDTEDNEKLPIITDFGGDGDAKFSYEAYNKLNDAEKQEILGNGEDNVSSNLCSKLGLIIVTTKGVNFMDIISGQMETIVEHKDLLKDETIFIQNASVAVNITDKEIILGLQSCLTRIVFSRRFKVSEGSLNSQVDSTASLIPKKALSSKSVLRKKIKSPPRQAPVYPHIKGITKGSSKSPATLPSWARSKSRPHLKSSSTKSRMGEPLSARSHSTVGTGSGRSGFLNVDIDSFTPSSVNVPAKGSYENDDVAFDDVKMITIPHMIPNGISVLRIAATSNGKHLAFGGSFSPLVVAKTKPFQQFRTFKDVSNVTSVHFNFEGNMLVLGSSDCQTTLVDWRNSKQLLSFDFTSKFNEHIHAQFYFMDKFILQPEENKVALYCYAKRDNGFIKLKAGEFQLPGQTITAMNAANQFYSNMIISGLSNKSIQIFDTNSEKVSVTIQDAHTRPITCIRINEAPQGLHATSLCDIFLTSTFSSFDPIKLWDIRSAKCIIRISDINQTIFVPTARPNISPCGRYIISGYEDNTVSFYDVRKIKTRLHTLKKIGTTVQDCYFDSSYPMVWCGCRNGSVLNFHLP